MSANDWMSRATPANDSNWQSRAQEVNGDYGGTAAADTPKATPYIDAMKNAAHGAVEIAKGLPSDIGAGLNHAIDGATFGYSPQLAGAQRVMGETLLGGVTSLDDIKKQYQAGKDEQLKSLIQASKDHPISSMVGGLGGALAVPIPGATEVKEASMGMKALKAAGKGAAYGFAMNPGDEQGNSGALQLDQRLGNAMFGAPLGLGGEAIAKGIEHSPEAIQSMRRYFTSKELGANTGQMKQLLRDLPGGGGMNRLDRMEQFLNENKLLNAGKTFSDIEDATKSIRSSTGSKIGDTYKNVEAEIANLGASDAPAAIKLQDSALHGPDLAQEYLASEKTRLDKIHGGAGVHDTLTRELGTPDSPVGLTSLGANVSIPDMVHYRASVDDAVNWAKRSSDRAPLEQSYVNLRNFLNDKVSQRIGHLDDALGSENTKSLKSLNAQYADATLANKIAETTKAREMAKFTPGLVGALSGVGYGGYGIAHGENPVEALAKGAALGVGMRAARAYAPGMLYSAARMAEPAAQKASHFFENSNTGAKLLTSPWVQLTRDQK